MTSKLQEKQIVKSTLIRQRDQFKMKLKKIRSNTEIIFENTEDGTRIPQDFFKKLKRLKITNINKN